MAFPKLSYAERLMIEAQLEHFGAGILASNRGDMGKEPPTHYTRDNKAAWWLGQEFYLAWQQHRERNPINVEAVTDPHDMLNILERLRNERTGKKPLENGGNQGTNSTSGVSAQFVPKSTGS